LAAGVVLALTNSETAFINRMNYLKSRTEAYLVEFENGKVGVDTNTLSLAEYYYRTLTRKVEDQSVFFATEGFCRYYLGKIPQAIQAYKRAVALEPHVYMYHWDLGMIYFQQRDYEQAAQYFSQSLNFLGTTLNYYNNLANGKKIRGPWQESYNVVLRLKQRAQDDEAMAVHLLAQSYFHLGQYQQMPAVVMAGLKKYPANPKLLYDFALAAFLNQQYQRASDILTRVIDLAPNYLNAYVYRQKAREALGDHQGALADQTYADSLRQGGATSENQDVGTLHSNIDLILLSRLLQ